MAFDPNAVRSGANASTNPTYLGAWVCYINGRYVPIQGFDTDSSVWAVPTFRVHLLPDPVLQRLGAEDRVQVVLFYLDQWYDPAKPEPRMLIDGEIIGWSFSNASGSRTIAFSCAAHLSVFKQLYFYYMSNVDDIVAARDPAIASMSVATSAGPIYPYGLFHQGLTPTRAQLDAERPEGTAATTPGTDTPSAATPIKAPYEFVTNVIRGCISSDVPDARRSVPAMNFFARWMRLVSFHNRWVRMPILEDPEKLAARVGVFPIFNAVRQSEALTAMQRHVAAQVGNSGNLWNLFQQVLGLVYMEVGAIPNPCSVLVQLNDTTGGEDSNPVDGRIIGYPDYGTPMVDQNAHQQQPSDVIDEFRRDLNEVLPGVAPGPEPAPPQPPRPGIDRRTPVRLAQYFVKPQVYFGEVPACNAIFPSMIEGWGFEENYEAQPTRVYINDSVMTTALRAEGANREFMLHALTSAWPEEAMALLHHHAGDAGRATTTPTESGRNLLIWPEEYYKGVVTGRAALPAWFQMLRQFTNSRAPGTAGNPTGGGTATAPGATPANGAENQRSLFLPSTVAGRGLTLDGREAANLRLGGGLDPVRYVPARITAPWPLDGTAAGGGARRGMGASSGSRTPYERLAQIVRGLRPLVRSIPGVTAANELAVAFGLAYVIQWENGVQDGAFYYSWALGNGKQYYLYPPVPWTVFPKDRTTGLHGAYQAANSFQEGLAVFARDIQRRYPQALRTLVTGHAPGAFGAFVRQRGLAESPYWAARGARPDLFYIHLGHIGYYASGREVGITRVQNIGTWFDNVSDLFARNAVPPDVIVDRPLPFPMPPLTDPATTPTGARGAPTPAPTTAAQTSVTRPNQSARATPAPGVTPPPPEPVAPQGGNDAGTAMDAGAPMDASVPDPTTTATGDAGVPTPVPDPGPEPSPGPAQPPAAAATSSTPTAASAATAEAPSAGAAGTSGGGDAFAALFSIYAQNEYLRERYAQRTASAQLMFNPYLVHGFPAMLFDAMATGMHTVGYVQRVSHSGMISQSGARMATTVQLSFCRTFYEFLADVKADAQRFAGRITSAPADIVAELREVLQDEENAEAFYGRLLHGGRELGEVDVRTPTNGPSARRIRRRAVLRWQDVLGFATRNGRTEAIEITGDPVSAVVADERASQVPNDPATAAATPAPDPATPATRTVVEGIDLDRELSPTETGYAEAFVSYDVALRAAARPCCTLDEYVRFWHGGASILELQRQGQVGAVRKDFAYARENVPDVLRVETSADGATEFVQGERQRVTAGFYERIYKLRPGPGPEPTDHQRGYTDPPDIAPTTHVEGLPRDYPQTRADWDRALDYYVEKVLSRVSPSR